jgi:hypothetical protein
LGLAAARVLATIPWGSPGGLERRLEPLSRPSLAPRGAVAVHVAASPTRTLPGGAVCIAGGGALFRVDPDGDRRSTALGRDAPLVDFFGLDDGTWVLLEPGHVHRVAGDGTELWSAAAALGGLLCDAGGALFGVTEARPRRLVTIDGETGAADEVQDLDDAEGPCFMNGAGRVGYAAETSWVTVDARTGEVSETRLEEGSGMDHPLGLDAEGRSYWNRFATLRRLTPAGRADWELEAGQAIVDRGRVWIQQRPADGSLVALAPDPDAAAIALPTPADGPRSWTLVGRGPGDSFVLHGSTGVSDSGVLARLGPDGGVADVTPAGDSVWSEWFEMQRPDGASVTDAGDVDVATRGPDGLHVIRITPL